MDIVRTDLLHRKKQRRILIATGAVIALAVLSLGISQLKPAAPVVEASTLWTDTVKRGPMVRQVRGTGTLVPEEVRWIPAATEGRIERVVEQPGALVTADTILLELSDPQQVQQALTAEWQLRAAEADLANLRARLESDRLGEEANAARLKAEYEQARLRADADEELARQKILPEITRKVSQKTAEELANRYELEKRRLVVGQHSVQAQMAAQRAQVEQRRALNNLQRTQLASLKVRAGINGVLQQINVEVGQRVTPGTMLAKVVDPSRLKAQIRVAETQAKDISIGQQAQIDTR